ncbi:hypothetical protein PFISCL1PPCAC_2268 [Pristionchus fissidentatus]|uniref:Mma-1 n=1 Tax=Pristionchus fissidentatus TaxID=1538716 RepID=A0AAV5UWS6_9BILA|nr:hypothetical protein PFISCL1PPCAC_2268 [Pristionchus fissidentatus]
MLRRAAPLVRALRSATSVAQSSTSAGTNGENVVVRVGREEKREVKDKRRNRRDFKPQVVDEHTQLLRKHGETIENTEVESLNDAIEKIQWYSTASSQTLVMVGKMLKKASVEELSSISDRSMAILFSSFGEMCKDKRRSRKTALMDDTIKEITEKGHSFGPLTRTAIFAARVDNAVEKEQLPSIVDEISAWESASLPLDEELILQAARVYAKQGDRKGVIELTNHARESFGRVDSRFVEWLAYSMVASGENGGIAAIEKLSARASPDTSLRLWLSAALAAACKPDLPTVLECLSRVSLTSKLNHTNENGPVVDALIELIERGVDGAQQAFAPYLALTADGSSLHERHTWNIILSQKARRAAKDGKIDVATNLYALVHPNYAKKSVETDLKRGFSELAMKSQKNLDELKRIVARMNEGGLIEDVNAELINNVRGKNLADFVQELRSNGELAATIQKSRLNKFVIASNLVKGASSGASVAPHVTAVLYAENITNREDRDDVERLVFKAVNEDVDTVLRVIQQLADSEMADAESVAGQLITSCISRLLMEKDVLSSGRVEKILNSPHLSIHRLITLESKMLRLLNLAKDEETTEKAVEMIIAIVTAAFKSAGHKTFETMTLIRFLGNTAISDERVEMIVKKLSQSPSVGIGRPEMEKAVAALEERGLKKRAAMIGTLKKKSQASQRWLASSVDELEMELNRLENSETMKTGVLPTIRCILMEKFVTSTSVPTTRLTPLLERVIPTINQKEKLAEGEKKDPWHNSRRLRMLDACEKVFAKTMREAVIEKDWEMARRLWKTGIALRSLPIAPSVALSFNESRGGSNELSAEIISTLRSKGQSIGAGDLTELGEFLRDLSPSDLSSASEWLKTNFRLEDARVANIQTARVKRTMTEMIDGGRLQEAFDLMKETSESAKCAIGHFDVMRAAIRSENTAVLESALKCVSSLHSQPTAILDLAYSFLMEKRLDYGDKLIKNPSLKLSSAKLGFYTKTALEEKRADVIRSLFTILVSCPLSDEKVSNANLNYLALATLRSYVNSEQNEEAREFIGQIEGSTLVVERGLKEVIDRVKRSARSSSV